jgi:hypothetical protein
MPANVTRYGPMRTGFKQEGEGMNAGRGKGGKPDICPPPGFLYEIKDEKKEMFQILIPSINITFKEYILLS